MPPWRPLGALELKEKSQSVSHSSILIFKKKTLKKLGGWEVSLGDFSWEKKNQIGSAVSGTDRQK